ncbi:MAG TPA: hypothetical protein VFJ16_11270 [Longimicrobium sp.]|nr:hypothetical protein [Longimicrobium sp.]
MRRRSVFRALSLLILTGTTLAACEQPTAARVSPQPLPDLEIATAPSISQPNPADVARAQATLADAIRDYNRLGSSYRAIVDQVAVKTQRLAIKHSPR